MPELPPLPDALPAPVVDTHCHLDATEEYSGLAPQQALDDAVAVNVGRIVEVGCDVESSRWAVDAAQRWANVVASVAMHPNDAARLGRGDLTAALDEIERLAAQPAVRGVGETGLDYYRTRDTEGQQIQRESFAAHIAFAKAYDKTLVIHDRDAHEAILEVLDAEGLPDRIVMHCFSGDAAFARACLDRGAHLSFAGTVTFKANEHLRDALAPRPARPDRGRDRCAVPDADAVPRPAERVLSHPAHRPVDRRRPRCGPDRAVPGARRQRRGSVRRAVVKGD